MPIARPVVAVLALALAFLSGAAALSSAFARVNPQLASRSPIARGPALENLASYDLVKKMAGGPEGAMQDFPKDVPANVVELARRALVAEPLSARAAALLALKAGATGDMDAARTLFRDAYRLTRRSEITTLWLARDAASRGDVVATLNHFDEVLRTSKEARTMVLARFAQATSDPSFRREMARSMRARPPWFQEFWSVAPDVEGATRAVGELRLALAGSGLGFVIDDDRKLVDRLLNNGEFDLVEALLRKETRAAAEPAGEFVRNSRFDRATVLPLAEWQTYSIGDYGSEIVPKDGLLLFSAITSPGGAVAREWVSLRPGAYVLRARLKTLRRGTDDRVLARMTCLTARAGTVRPIDITLEDGDTLHPFTIPAGCSQYWLDVVAAPAEQTAGFDGELDLLSIRSAR
jgi:hypothetical protein